MASLNNHSPLPVLLDTNFILSCYQFGIHIEEIDDIIDESYEILVPQNVLEELEQLKLGGKEREARRTMVNILEPYRILPLQGAVDKSLLEYASTHDCIICTNDRALRKNLRKMGKKSLFVRARSHLKME